MEFDASFTFDAGESGKAAQSPWDLQSALKQAIKGGPQKSVEDRIASYATGGQKKAARQAEKRKRGANGCRVDLEEDSSEEEGDDDDEEEEEEDEEGMMSEDEPLPGELDDGDEEAGETERGVSQLEEGEDDNDDDGDDGGRSSETEEEEGGGVRQQQRAGPSRRGGRQAVEGKANGQEADTKGPKPSTSGSSNNARRDSGRRASDKPGFYSDTPGGTRFRASSFSDLNLSRPLLKVCDSLGFQQPTPIQAACIPLALAGRDIVASAMTGSGKTAAYALPLLERLLYRASRVSTTHVLVLVPTRELAAQVHGTFQTLAQHTDVSVALAVGGLSLSVQAATLRNNPEVVVATPGRIIDHVRNTQSVGLEALSAVVLDEGDRLLEEGFEPEILEIMRMAPRSRQTMLFSATMNESVRKLVKLCLDRPVRLAADPSRAAPRTLTQQVVRLKGQAAQDKEAVLMALCARSFRSGGTLVFFNTKLQAHRMRLLFGLSALPGPAELHGNMTQAARLEALDAFRQGSAQYLLCTDVAARGLDIVGVQTVINYDAPRTLETYLHRIGRTARAGRSGLSVTLVEDTDHKLIKQVIKKAKADVKLRVVPQPTIDSWRQRLEEQAEDLESILKEERMEAALRKAEMEAEKAQNLLDHQDEIKARPKRTWFMTEKEKKAAAERARSAAAQGEGDGDDGAAAEGPPKKKTKAEKNRERKGKDQGKQKVNKVMAETDSHKVAVKGAKSLERKLRLQGMKPSEASKAAAKMVSGVKKQKQKKKAKPCDSPGKLADGPQLPSGPSRVYSGGGKSRKVVAPKKTTLSKSELNRVKRGGKGKSSFKSRARHKRR